MQTEPAELLHGGKQLNEAKKVVHWRRVSLIPKQFHSYWSTDISVISLQGQAEQLSSLNSRREHWCAELPAK